MKWIRFWKLFKNDIPFKNTENDIKIINFIDKILKYQKINCTHYRYVDYNMIAYFDDFKNIKIQYKPKNHQIQIDVSLFSYMEIMLNLKRYEITYIINYICLKIWKIYSIDDHIFDVTILVLDVNKKWNRYYL